SEKKGSRKKSLARKRAGEKQSEESTKRKKIEDDTDHENEMAFELLRFIRSQLAPPVMRRILWRFCHEAYHWPNDRWFILWWDRHGHKIFRLGAKDRCHNEGLFGVSPWNESMLRKEIHLDVVGTS
ncbi:hypothetical protein Tco_1452271, partial [Tanacetum coccineum]